MKLKQLFSGILAGLLLCAAFPLTAVPAAAASTSSTAEVLPPPTLPGDPDTILKWGYYPSSANGGKTDFWYGNQLGTLSEKEDLMPAETRGKAYTLAPLADAKTLQIAAGSNGTTEGAKLVKGEQFAVSDFANGGKIYDGAAGLMIRIRNLTTSMGGGFGITVTINGTAYRCTPGMTDTTCFISHYDYKNSVWKVEPLNNGCNNARIPTSYDGYIYIPFESFYNSNSMKQLDRADLTKYGISKFQIMYVWQDAGAILKDISTVYLPPFGVINGVGALVRNDLGLRASATVLTASDEDAITMDFTRAGKTVSVPGVRDGETDNYTFDYTGILARQLTDPIKMELKVNGEVLRTVENYTLDTYATRLISSEDSTPGAQRAMADLLWLGSVAQKISGYNTSALAGASLTEAQSAMRSAVPKQTDVDGAVLNVTKGSDTSCQWITATLPTSIWLSAQINFDAESTEGLTVTATVGDKTYTYDKFYPVENHYAFVFDHVNITDFSETVTFTFNREGTGTLECNLAGVIRGALGSKNGGLRQYAGSVYNFYASVKAFGERLPVITDGVSQYALISSAKCPDSQITLLSQFVTEMKAKTGARILQSDDLDKFNENSKQIVVNATRWEESAKRLDRLSYSAFSIEVSGNKIYISAYSDMAMQNALSYLSRCLVQNGDDWELEAGLDVTVELGSAAGVPKYASAKGNYNYYYAGNGDFEVCVSGTTADEFQTYTAALTGAGFTVYTTNRIGECDFTTYRGGDGTILQLAWLPTLGSGTAQMIICDPDEYIPPVEEASYQAISSLTPYVLQIGRASANDTAPGMSYLIQLADGRYIVIDGGGANESDSKALLKYMKDHMPAGQTKPVIAAWMISHPHGDHMGLAISFLTNHYSEVEVQMAAYNFPDFDYVTVPNETMTNAYQDSFIDLVKQHYPDAKHWIMHSGQKFRIAGAEIDVIFTHEDLFPLPMPWGNHASSSWRFTINGVTAFFVGDSETTLCDKMAATYGDALQSDILQLSHHGFNGATLALYQVVDPKICLWPTDGTRFAKDGRCLGLQADASNYQKLISPAKQWDAFNFNYWIRNTKWTRGDVTGDRKHYHASSNTVVYFNADLTCESSQTGNP